MRSRLRRAWIRVTADRRKFGMLCAIVGLALLLWARLLIISDMPRTAIARPEAGEGGADTAPTPAESDKSDPPIRATLYVDPSRDPFAVDDRYFPRPTPLSDLPADLGKSNGKEVEDPREAEARVRARLQDLVDRFTLDAVMSTGGMAVIDGATIRIGDSVAAKGSERISFSLAEVRQRSVVFIYEGRRFELKMTGPGD